MSFKMTRDLAWAAACDVADKNMRKGGRTKWNGEDYRMGGYEFERLWPLEKDLGRMPEQEKGAA
jgi:hypothetical protein